MAGIGGEWASGVLLVAENMPEHRRVAASVTLYTSAPAGLFLATLVNFVVAGLILPQRPDISWRVVFAFGLLPAVVAIGVRLLLNEPEKWEENNATTTTTDNNNNNNNNNKDETSSEVDALESGASVGIEQQQQQQQSTSGSISELWSRQYLHATLSGLVPAIVATLVWWSVSAFIPIIATGMAMDAATERQLSNDATQSLIERWKLIATASFNAGGLVGTILTYPVAEFLGRKLLYTTFYTASCASLVTTFVLSDRIDDIVLLLLYFPIGIAVFGVFGSFTFYLPELFPQYLRGTGAGFCYNAGRFIAAAGPFIVGYVSSRDADDAYDTAVTAMVYVGLLPLIGVAASFFQVETRHQEFIQ
jgi:MFS family permease